MGGSSSSQFTPSKPKVPKPPTSPVIVPISTVGSRRQEESSFEAECRQQLGFNAIEERLDDTYVVAGMGLIDKLTGFLGSKNPFAQPANPDKNKIILFDNIAYRPVPPYGRPTASGPRPWQAEFAAAYFQTGRRDVGSAVSTIADTLGLDGQVGADQEARSRIEQRVQTFIDQIAPARTVEIVIPQPGGTALKKRLGPSDTNGISTQLELVGGDNQSEGKNIQFSALNFDATGHTHFAGPEGWAVISDIDDTIKVTQTTSPTGILRTTFADEPQPIPGMSELYKALQVQFKNPAWFYLSASPYNLYPFLHKFIHDHYQPGMLILRDFSWMVLGDLLRSLTKGTKNYKTDRIEKVHTWLPDRKFILIGDSTQSDPESYAKIYRKYPADWIQAIYIRKATDVANMEEKNKDERFQTAFKSVPSHIWKVFEQPEELADHLRQLVSRSGMPLSTQLRDYPAHPPTDQLPGYPGSSRAGQKEKSLPGYPSKS